MLKNWVYLWTYIFHNLVKPLFHQIGHFHTFLKKAMGILQSPQSVRLSCPPHYLLLNPWTKSNQIWCVSCSHEWDAQRHNIFGSHPLGPWKGVKKSNIFKFQLQSQLQKFLNQSCCVFSQMKDIKHIRPDFHSVSWVMPQGWDLGGEVKNLFFPKLNQNLVCEGGGGGFEGVNNFYFF